MKGLPLSRRHACPPVPTQGEATPGREPFSAQGPPHATAPHTDTGILGRPASVFSRPDPAPSGGGVAPQEVLALRKGRYFRLRYHGRLLP